MENNTEIRNAIFKNNIKKWEVANKLGVTDSTFSRMLRNEMSEENKKKILKIIDNYRKEVK